MNTTNLEKINYHLGRIELFERDNLNISKMIKQEKDKNLKAKLKSKVKYNESMIKHSKNMIDIYHDSVSEVNFNHSYE